MADQPLTEAAKLEVKMEKVMFQSPGPAQYMLPPETGGPADQLDARKRYPPAYTLRVKPPLLETNKSPGPAAYAIKDGANKSGAKKAISYSMRIKPNTLKTAPIPGPQYPAADPSATTESRAAAYSIRPLYTIAGEDERRAHIPGANMYRLPNLLGDEIRYSSPGRKVSSEKWSMTGRSDHGSFAQVIAGIPGPGAHRPEDCVAKVKSSAPHYTLRPRHYMPNSKSNGPGPKYNVSNHSAQKPKRTIPGGGFGQRASNFMHVAIE